MFNITGKKLTVVTICYNDPDLDLTCQSIVNQTWQDFEWIVVDGGSRQETLDVFSKYDKRIDKFISEPDEGIYDACNKGAKLASSKYIIFMNAGDSFYDKYVLENIFKHRFFTPDVLYGDSYYDFKDESKNYIKNNPPKLTRLFFTKNNLNTQSLFIKKSLFEKYGYYDLKYRIASDLDRLLCFISNGATFKFVPYVIANYDKNGISSDSGARDLRIQENNEIRNRYFSKEDYEYLKRIYDLEYNIIWNWKNNFFSIVRPKKNFPRVLTILGKHILLKD